MKGVFPGVTAGTAEFRVTPSTAVRVLNPTGTAPLGSDVVSLANPQGDLRALVTEADGVTLYLEGLAASEDVSVKLSYRDSRGWDVAKDQVSLSVLREDAPEHAPKTTAEDHTGHSDAHSYWDIIGPLVVGFGVDQGDALLAMERGGGHAPYFVSRSEGAGENIKTRYFMIADKSYTPYSPGGQTTPINGELDTYWFNENAHRYDAAGKHKSDGMITVSFPNYRAFDALRFDGRVISEKAKLYLCVYDLDDHLGGDSEKVRLTINGNLEVNGQATYLASAPGTTSPNSRWQVIEIEFPTMMLHFAKVSTGGSYPEPALNTVALWLDHLNGGWALEVDWAVIQYDAMSPVILVHGTGMDASFWNGGWFGGNAEVSDTDFLDAIRERGVPYDASINVTTGALPGDASIVKGGTKLFEQIPRRCKEHGSFSYTAVCHSKGGLWFRAGWQQMESSPSTRNLSLTAVVTLSTPHWGSVLGSFVQSFWREDDAKAGIGYLTISGQMPLYFRDLYEEIRRMWWPPDPRDVRRDEKTLSEYRNPTYADIDARHVGEFNVLNVPFLRSYRNVDGSVPAFFGLTADADLYRNGIIEDRGVGNLKAEYFPLHLVRTLQPGATPQGFFTEVYWALRWVIYFDSVASGGTISFFDLQDEEETALQDNDLYVTVDSGQGKSRPVVTPAESLTDLITHVLLATWRTTAKPDSANHGTVCSGEAGAYVLDHLLPPLR